MTSQGTEGTGSVRYFSGEAEDGKEYKRWKVWCKNKLLTLDKLPEASRGPYIYTLLSGKALETVEHVDPESYQKKGGDEVLWELLDKRFPQKDEIDELGEVMGEIFNLRIKESESIKAWIGRSQELFERCKRKTSVDFPDQARGWLTLHRCGLSDEQVAVVIARARGSLSREAIGIALRSCYPDYVGPKRRSAAAVEEVFPVEPLDGSDDMLDEFGDVQELIESHGPEMDEEEVFPEEDVAEVLAASWKEKRGELNRLQKARPFSKVKEVKRQFRVEVEELKAKTKCHRCGMTGHWARECSVPKGKGKGASSRKPASSSTSGAGLVEEQPAVTLDFVASVSPTPSLVEQVRGKCAGHPQFDVALISSPGFGVIDSGCGRTIIGAATLRDFQKMWSQRGIPSPTAIAEVHQFKYGNGEVETSRQVMPLPVRLAGKQGVIRASVVQGHAPLLISRSALKALGAVLDFQNDSLQLFGRNVPLQINQAGQYVVDVMSEAAETAVSEPPVQMTDSVGAASVSTAAPESQPMNTESTPPTKARGYQVWVQEDSQVNVTPCISSEGPTWKHVFRRIVRRADDNKVLHDHTFTHHVPQSESLSSLGSARIDVISEFHFRSKPEHSPKHPERSNNDHESSSSAWKPTRKQARRLHAQLEQCNEVCAAGWSEPADRIHVMEVFSPPRFAPIVEERGKRARSYDLKTGYDFNHAKDRDQVEEDIKQHRPELLILCPPCTHEGGWFHLNATKMDKWEYLRVRARSRGFIRWCCRLFKLQTSLGGRVVFEHPTGASTWSYPEVQQLCKKHTTVKLHMRRYHMRLPGSSKLIRKSTRLLTNDDNMQQLGLLCPGNSDPMHCCHDVVKGSAPGVPSVSVFAGQYPPAFVRAVLDVIPSLQEQPVLSVIEDSVSPEQWDEVMAVSELDSKNEKELLPIIKRLHQNLGHPPNHDLVRILKHGQASEAAIQIARQFTCDFCKSQVKPSVPLPAQTHRIADFNQQIGMDVKHLRGWLPNQKIKALNIVDSASSFQRVIPFFQAETSPLLRQLLNEHWITWAGPPKEIVLDPAPTNLGEPLVVSSELQGTNVRPIAAGAHWQLGKTESHGGWFAHVLDRLIEEHQPSSKEEWLECVHHAHIKNQVVQVHGFSPHQYVFGKGVHLPDDLLSEPLHIVPATASLSEEGLARSQAMRLTARTALAQMQDSKAMRKALLARPRRAFDFVPGQCVAYWRNQKWVQGQLMQGGRWHGPAVVLGTVGRNLILLHRKHLIRCAPEQVRPSTTEERQLIQVDNTELTGVKELVEKGDLQNRNYVDLLPQSYPPMQGETDASLEQIGEQMQAVSPEPVPPVDQNHPQLDPPPLVEPQSSVPEPRPNADESIDSSSQPHVEPSAPETQPSSSYGPVRRRVTGRDGPLALYRPPAMKQDDFVEVMKEVVPELIDQVMLNPANTEARGDKRQRSDVAADSEDAAEPAPSRPRVNEVLSVQECGDLLASWDDCSAEVFMTEYIKRKMSKELHHSNNPPKLQAMIDAGKRAEWETLLSKENGIRIHYGKAAVAIRKKHPDRFMGSRFVLTRKPIEEGREINSEDLSTFTVKGRWCLQGHLDPDLQVKAEEGLLKSPTLSQLGRMTIMQVISSMGWVLQLGDIKGAFLEAGPIDDRFRPLFAEQPAGGVPGLPSDAVIEVCGNIYGQNNAPSAWFREFSSFSQSVGWTQSRLDQCVYTLRDPSNNKLVGVMGVHVDDTAVAGEGKIFESAIKALKERFPYRKWRTRSGEFCGAWYDQKDDGTIHMSMSGFVDKIRPINIPKHAEKGSPLTPAQIKVLRAVNGSLNWLSSQSRPDLAVQTSLSQQAFPNPTIDDLRCANQAVRRARQEKDLGISFSPIPVDELTVICHSDAAWANRGHHTQAGYVIAFTQAQMQEGKESMWCPASWRSHKLSRAVSSTLGAEAQSMSVATSTVEWLCLLLSEILDGPLNIPECRKVLSRRRPILVTDCKSLYDHLHSPSSPTSIEDRRTSIDIVIIRESCRLMNAFIRWVPTNRMIADGLTKDCGDPVDLLRSCWKRSKYQISDEDSVLQHQALEKQKRMERRTKISTSDVQESQ